MARRHPTLARSARRCTPRRPARRHRCPGTAAHPPDPAERHRQAAERAATIPGDAFEPFDRATALASDTLNLCERWPNAPLAPDFGPGPLPDVPVLLLEGEDDLRTPVENAQRVGALFPQSSLVVAPATGHSALGSDISGCTERAFERFFRDEPVAPLPEQPAPVPAVATAAATPLRREPVRRHRPARVARSRAVRLTLLDVAEDSTTELFFDPDDSDGPAAAACARGTTGSTSTARSTLDGVAFVPGVIVSGRLERFAERRQRGASE